jgi:hypothetical protein
MKFNARLLEDQAFCEYRIYLTEVKKALSSLPASHGIFIQGTTCYGVADTIMTVNDHTIITLIRDISFWITPARTIVPVVTPYGDIRHALALCLAYRETHPDHIIFARLQDKQFNTLYQSQYLDKPTPDLVKSIARIQAILGGKTIGYPTKNKTKCMGCRANEYCDKKVG